MSVRDIIDEATPGPWERGDHWHIQGASQCQCRDSYGPLVYEGRMDIDGRMMAAHVHRMAEPWMTVGITTAWLDERTHEPYSVVIETDEYGLMDDADARFIATFDPEHVALMEAVCVAAAIYRNTRSDGDLLVLLAESDRLQTYRKEHGL